RRHTRQSPCFLPFEDPPGKKADLPVSIGNARPVAHQAPGLDVIALAVDRRNSVSGRQRHNPFPLGQEEPASTANQRASPTLDERCKGGLDFAFAADVEDFNLLPRGRSRSSYV